MEQQLILEHVFTILRKKYQILIIQTRRIHVYATIVSFFLKLRIFHKEIVIIVKIIKIYLRYNLHEPEMTFHV